mmetsp:Transcript_28766/g.33199  ORF Transcript_28766/g.33199 Transcript_28766/m.33199 type:complete len:294 (-) Transcript_28766:166-1047(-)
MKATSWRQPTNISLYIFISNLNHLIEDREHSMMRENLILHSFSFLPQQPVYLHCSVFNSFFSQRLSYSFNSNNSISSYLNFKFAAGWYLLLVFNNLFGILRIFEDPNFHQDLRNSVIREHSQLINIVKLPVILSFESAPQISHQDLHSLIQENLVAFIDRMVSEIREGSCKNLNQLLCAFLRGFNHINKLSIIVLQAHCSHFSHDSISFFYQREIRLAWEDRLLEKLKGHFYKVLWLEHLVIFHQCVFQVGGQMLVLPIRLPEAEVERVHNENVVDNCILSRSVKEMESAVSP